MRNYSKMVKTGNIERHCNSFLCAVVILCFLSTKKYKCGKKSVVKIKKSHKPQSQSDNDLACGFLITLIYKLAQPPQVLHLPEILFVFLFKPTIKL